MAKIKLQDLIEAGCHFGSRTSRWNPKMAPYILGKRSGVHIFDLRETLKGIIRAQAHLRTIASKNGRILFVGTKRQAVDVIRREATRAKSFFVCNRWLGGTLTNMATMHSRVTRLEELESLEASGRINQFSKKMISSLTRERKKIFRNFEGIRDMKNLPAAMIIVDPKEEEIAVLEAIKCDIPVIGVVDSDTDPTPIDFIIPANDDSIRSLDTIISALANAVIEGQQQAGGTFVPNKSAQATRTFSQKAQEVREIKVPKNISDLGAVSFGGNDNE